MTTDLKEVRGCKLDGNEPWRPSDFKVRLTTMESWLHETPSHLQGLGSEGFQEVRRCVELLSVCFHERRAKPWSSMENEREEKKKEDMKVCRRTEERRACENEGIGGGEGGVWGGERGA